jgi:hypothetical protein
LGRRGKGDGGYYIKFQLLPPPCHSYREFPLEVGDG